MAGVETRTDITQGYQLPIFKDPVVINSEFDNQIEMFDVFLPSTIELADPLEMATMQDGFDLNGNTH